MLKSFNSLRHYYHLAGVKFSLIFSEFVTFLIPSVLSVVSPILTAKVISSLTVYDFSRAIFFLSIDFGIIVLTSILYLIYHIISNKTSKKIIGSFEEFVYTSARQNKNLSKIQSSTLANIWSCADFNRTFLYKICFLIKSLIILGIIIYFNFIIGIILVAVSIITFLLLRITNSKIKSSDFALTGLKQNSLELLNNIKQGSKETSSPEFENSLKEKYFSFVGSSVNLNNKISLLYNINNNFISLILKTAVFAFSVYLVTLVKTTALTLTIYLILTPYLTSSAENLIAFFEIFPELAILENALQEFESLRAPLASSSKPLPLKNFTLCFSDVDYNGEDFPKLKDLSAIVPEKTLALVEGDRGCGKRTIFKLLQKSIKPDLGNILIGSRSLYDLDEDTYGSVFGFTCTHPYFYSMSIIENLMLACKDRQKIQRTLKLFGLAEKIEALPNGQDTPADEKLPENLRFFLGLTREYLAKKKIVVIYETPENFSALELSLFAKILSLIKKESSILLFTHSGSPELSYDQKLVVQGGKIRLKKDTKNN